MSKGLVYTVLVFLGFIVLFYIAQQLLSEHRIPSFGDIVASSTQSVASSTVSTVSSEKTYSSITHLPSKTIIASKGSVKAFVAENDTDRENGLSGQSSLPHGVGMLFVFDTPGKYGFWMKDMDFSIDMIWIGADKKVVGVTKNVLSSSYPFVFMPPKDILYVLEMNAGSVVEFGLTTGTQLKF